MFVRCVSFKFAGTDLYECNAGAVVGIHVGVDLEHESGEVLFRWLNLALFSLDWAWRWCYLYKAVQQLFHSECIEC